MRENTKNRRKPAIVISKSDHARLDRLAAAAAERLPEASEELSSELDRARIVSDTALAADVARMGSVVEFEPDSGASRMVTLGFPEDANISEGKVSILTPIGTALLGLKPGQSISWQSRDGRSHDLTIVSVRQPGAEPRAEAAAVHADA